MVRTTRRDITSGVAVIAVAAFFLWETTQLPALQRGSDDLDPRIVPAALLLILVALATALIVRAVLTSRRTYHTTAIGQSAADEFASAENGAPSPPEELESTSRWPLFAAALLLLLAYTMALGRIGVLIASLGFLAALSLLLTRNLKQDAIFSICFAAGLYVLFDQLLGIRFR